MKSTRPSTLIVASIAALLLGSLALYSDSSAAPPCGVVKSKDCPSSDFITILNSGDDGTALIGVSTAANGGVGVHGMSSGTGGTGVIAESTGSGRALEARGQSYFTDKIGIGSVAPIGWFTITADGSFGNQYFRMEETTSGQTWVHVLDALGRYQFFDNNTNTSPLVILPGGNIGIGTIAPSERLEVAGNVCAAAYLVCSDRRFKEDIQPIESALDKVLQMNGVTYSFSEEFDTWAGAEQGDTKQVGLIAQDVEKVCPEAVSTMDDGYRSVDYSKLTAVLVEAMKAQQAQIEALESRIEELSAQR